MERYDRALRHFWPILAPDARCLAPARQMERRIRHGPVASAGPDGEPATTAAQWRTTSRPHQLQLLEKAVYGRRLPDVPVQPVGSVERIDVKLDGRIEAVRLQARLRLGVTPQSPITDVLLYLPRSSKPVPVFLNLNFKGNQAEHLDRTSASRTPG
jgi:hypothetical protein